MEETAIHDPEPTEMTVTKRCRICGTTKPIDDFPKNKAWKDGHEKRCKQCKQKRDSEWKLERDMEARETGQTQFLTVVKSSPDPNDFQRLGQLLSGRRYDRERLTEIRGLCESIGSAIDTYLTLHEMFQGE